MHQLMAATMDDVVEEIHRIQKNARAHGFKQRPIWPMIIMKTPKGWTGPKTVDGKPAEGSWRSHQVPFGEVAEKPGHLKLLEKWMRSYKAQELFDKNGTLHPELAALAPKGDRRMGANPHTNGGKLLRSLKLPDFRSYAVNVPKPGAVNAEATRRMGMMLRDVIKLNESSRNFRIFGPDETASNRLGNCFEVTDRQFTGEILKTDDHLSRPTDASWKC